MALQLRKRGVTRVVGVPYTCKDILAMDEVTGGSPYGASNPGQR